MNIKNRKEIAVYTFEALRNLSIDEENKKSSIRIYTDKKGNKIEIFQIKNIIEKGINIFATIGVNEHNIDLKINNLDLGVEFIALSNKSFNQNSNIDSKIPDILTTCSSCIKNSKYKCYPGAIFLDVIEYFYPNTDMKHILFTNLLPYMKDLKTLYLEDKVISWLLAVPISEEEYKYSLQHSIEELEILLEKHQVDIANLDRKSVI